MSLITAKKLRMSYEFPNRSFTLNHALNQHPLFTHESLMQLGRSINRTNLHYGDGNVNINQVHQGHKLNGLTPEATIKNIASCNSWVLIRNVENIKEYRNMLESCLAELIPSCSLAVSGIDNAQASIMMCSPNTIFPFHIDCEHQFSFQITGTQKLYICDSQDRLVLPEDNIEQTYLKKSLHNNIRYRPEFSQRAKETLLSEQEGVYLPVGAPHWIKVNDAVSVVFIISFESDYSRRQARLYTCNARLRANGINPRPVGETEWVDTVKDYAYRAYQKIESTAGARR